MRLAGLLVLTGTARGPESLWQSWAHRSGPSARCGAKPFARHSLAAKHAVVNQPEVCIGDAAKKFDAQGNLTDEKTKELIGKLVVNLVEWTRRIALQ